MGLRKLLVAVVACLSALLVVPAPAGAVASCGKWERRVFAITATGGLVQHTFCLDANRTTMSRWTSESVVATTGWADTATAFWSGKLHDSGGVYYRVSASTGALLWSNDLTSWRYVGTGRDWRDYTSLISTEPGVIYGTDRYGVLHRWAHLGWRDGSNQWSDDVPLQGSPGARLLGSTSDGLVGVPNVPNVVQVWTPSLAAKFRIFVPPGVDPNRLVPFDLELRFRNSAFGLTSAGRIVVLLPTVCAEADRMWKADDETGAGGYRLIFAGNYVPYSGPVEWQCNGMTPGPAN
ncbi:hypothetical protein [Lentzea sp. NPDC004782]|uniref:hypothetical protein n=1 Tax=Lentzea sp. NPDC004782 TaxID=3154458 RepID=UPI00339E56EC